MTEILDFGKKTSAESFFNGKIVGKKTTYEVPIRVQNKNQALNEIMKALDVISNGQSDDVTIRIENDKKSGCIRMITKTYTVDE